MIRPQVALFQSDVQVCCHVLIVLKVFSRVPRPSLRLCHSCLLESSGELQCSLYVPLLAVFVASSQKDDQGLASLRVIHPVAGSVVDANLGYSLSDGPHVAEVAQGHPSDAAVDAHSGLPVPKPPKPTSVHLGLAYLDHYCIVVHRILGRKAGNVVAERRGGRQLTHRFDRYPQAVPRLAMPRERWRAIAESVLATSRTMRV